MSLDPQHLSAPALAFLGERHLATLTTLRPDGSPHVVPVGFSYDPAEQVVRIITSASSRKAAHAGRPGARAAVSQIDGGRWLTLEGPVEVSADPERVALAVAGYAARYRPPSAREDRVALEIHVERILGRA